MDNVGLGYLALGRSAKTLSGGESQRIRLAAQLGSNLRGVLYVLDEPTIGLHPRDNVRLLDTLTALRKKGNSLVIVEHDEETMRRADHIIDLGPRAGAHGGEVVATGTLREIERAKNFRDGTLFENAALPSYSRKTRRALRDVEHWIEVQRRAREQSEKYRVFAFRSVASPSSPAFPAREIDLDARSPLAGGARRAGTKRQRIGNGELFKLVERRGRTIEAVYEVDQSPIGKTSRSTPATYIKVFDEIRNLYAQLPVSRMRGYSARAGSPSTRKAAAARRAKDRASSSWR